MADATSFLLLLMRGRRPTALAVPSMLLSRLLLCSFHAFSEGFGLPACFFAKFLLLGQATCRLASLYLSRSQCLHVARVRVAIGSDMLLPLLNIIVLLVAV